MAGAGAEDFNHRIIEEFRTNGGRVGGPLAGIPMLLLHHIGARSRIERVTPLAYMPQGDGRYVIVASCTAVGGRRCQAVGEVDAV